MPQDSLHGPALPGQPDIARMLVEERCSEQDGGISRDGSPSGESDVNSANGR